MADLDDDAPLPDGWVTAAAKFLADICDEVDRTGSPVTRTVLARIPNAVYEVTVRRVDPEPD